MRAGEVVSEQGQYAAALADKRVLEAIGSGRHQRIAVCFVEWSGVGAQKLLIDWMVINGAESARKFGDNLLQPVILTNY